MNRGYSLVYDEDNQHLLQSVNQTATGKTLQVRLVDGRLICKVEQIKQHLDNREDGSDE
jgi:exodeoxyribonuclease VII large subunit